MRLISEERLQAPQDCRRPILNQSEGKGANGALFFNPTRWIFLIEGAAAFVLYDEQTGKCQDFH